MVPFDTITLCYIWNEIRTPAITTRGIKEDKMSYIVELIDEDEIISTVKTKVNTLLQEYKMFITNNS